MGRGAILDTVQIGTVSFVTLTSVLANSVLLGASLCRKSAVTSGDLLMAAMAVADILLTVVAVPLNLMADFELLGSGRTMLCVVANSPSMSFPSMTLFMLLSLTVERCINIFKPLQAKQIVTRRRVAVIVTVVFIYHGILTLLLPLGAHNIHIRQQLNSSVWDCNFAAVATAPLVAFMLLGNLIPGMLVLLVLNGAIFYVARKHLQRISDFQPASMTPDRREEIASYKRQKSRSNAVMFVCQLYILSYLPVATAITIDFQGFTVQVIEEWRAPFILYAAGVFMASFNTVFFPIILIKSNAPYKEWIRVKLLRRMPQNAVASHSLSCRSQEVTFTNGTTAKQTVTSAC